MSIFKMLRSSSAGVRPAGRSVGEFYVNFADRQFGVCNPAAVDLIAVRFWSALSNYAIGDYVVSGGNLYRSATYNSNSIPPSSDWDLVGGGSSAGDLVTSVAGRIGDVVLAHTDITDWAATLAPYALNSALASYLPLAGGTVTGVLTVQGPNSFVLNAPSGQQRAILGQTSGLTRWQMNLGDITTEGVGNTGSNFALTSYGGTGSFIANVLTINRATGVATFSAIPSFPGGLAGQYLQTDGAGNMSWQTPAGGGGGIPDAPSDGNYYSRHNAGWAVAPTGIADAANDGTLYARKSAGWAHVTHTDITDWTATLAPYALVTSVPLASTTTPAMNGTAAVGTGTTWARADHVHPTDTTRYSASNPSGYQTAAQVTTSLASYLPLAGGTLTGSLGVQGPVDLRVGTLTQSGASLAINSATNENWTLSLSASITSISITGWPSAGFTGKVRLAITNGGAFTMSGWPAGTIWPGGTAPVITSGAGKRDIILLMSDDGGTTIYGSVVGQDYH